MFGIDVNPVEIAQEVANTVSSPRKRPRWRTLITIVALFVGIVIYRYVVDFYPNRDLFSQMWRGMAQEHYSFYTGAEGGFYIQLGELMEKQTKGKRSPITVNNETSSGAVENVHQIMANERSFGLIQEDTLRVDDQFRRHLHYIAPLYLERMHILYDHDHWVEFKKTWNEKHAEEIAPENPSLRIHTHPTVKAFFRDSNVSIGPVGSGSRTFAGYLLDFCQV